MSGKRKELDCVSCGACCVYFAREPERIPIDKHDPNKGLLLDGDWAHKNENGDTFMQRNECGSQPRCKALKGKIGEYAVCDVYENRAQTCRDFNSGYDLCLDIRKAFFDHK